MSDHYDRQGNPISDIMGWSRLHDDQDYRRVAEDTYGHYWVSTVWLGLDHSYGSGPPLIFESMVFDQSDNDESDVDCRRYSTEAEAFAGHQEILEEMRKGIFCGYQDDPLDTSYEITEEPSLT